MMYGKANTNFVMHIGDDSCCTTLIELYGTKCIIVGFVLVQCTKSESERNEEINFYILETFFPPSLPV